MRQELTFLSAILVSLPWFGPAAHATPGEVSDFCAGLPNTPDYVDQVTPFSLPGVSQTTGMNTGLTALLQASPSSPPFVVVPSGENCHGIEGRNSLIITFNRPVSHFGGLFYTFAPQGQLQFTALNQFGNTIDQEISTAPTTNDEVTADLDHGIFTTVHVEAVAGPALGVGVDSFHATEAVVPEPGTFAVLGAGLLGFGILRRNWMARIT